MYAGSAVSCVLSALHPGKRDRNLSEAWGLGPGEGFDYSASLVVAPGWVGGLPFPLVPSPCASLPFILFFKKILIGF